MKILLVEDTVGEPIAKVVRRWGHEVLLAASAAEARLILMDQTVDLLLVDWMLPGPSGVDLVQQLHREQGGKQAPVIMISGRMQQRDIDAALDAGVDAYLAKPFTAAELRARIEEVVGRWQQRLRLQPAIERILALQKRFHARDTSPLVVVAERACTGPELLRAGAAVVGTLASLAEAVDRVNSIHLDLNLGCALVDHSAGLVRLLQMRTLRRRVHLVVISVEAGGTPVAAARMLAGRADMGSQLMVVCRSPEDLGLRTWYALEEAGVVLERRGLLDTQRWEQLLLTHVVQDEDTHDP